MNVVTVPRIAAEADTPTNRAAADFDHDVGGFLAAVAALLHDTVLRVEETVSQIAQTVVSRRNAGDHELIITLQKFDRLQQEFAALGEALVRYAETLDQLPSAGERHHRLGQEVIATIPIGDLQQRLRHRLGGATTGLERPPEPDEVIF